MRSIPIIASTIGALAIGALASPTGVRASGCEMEPSSVAAHIFDMSDTNEDGFLSLVEFADAGLERYGVTFDEFDVNGDGETSVDEYFDLFEYHHPPKEMI